jgi:hypothetical protein
MEDVMKDARCFRAPPFPKTGVQIIGVLALVLVTSFVFGHGGKDHGSEFTALKALPREKMWERSR